MLITSGATGGKTHPLDYSDLQELDFGLEGSQIMLSGFDQVFCSGDPSLRSESHYFSRFIKKIL